MMSVIMIMRLHMMLMLRLLLVVGTTRTCSGSPWLVFN
jgi:hypothetical protein